MMTYDEHRRSSINLLTIFIVVSLVALGLLLLYREGFLVF